MTDDSALQPWIEAGFFDPHAEGAAETREVLEFYDSLGIDPTDYLGVDPDDLMSTVNMRIIQPGSRVSAEAACEQAGLTPGLFERLCHTAGYALDGEFTEIDIEAFRSFALASDVFSQDALNDFARVLSHAMGRVADATTALFRVDIASHIEAAGGREVEYARKNQEMTDLVGAIAAPMQAFFLKELTTAVRLGDEARRAVTSDSVTTIRVAVGFLDIVGYTQLAVALPPDELADFITDFESRASGLVAEHGGRVAKLIGDAIMFVAVDPTAAVAVAEAIIKEFDGTTSTPRGGVAHGEVVALGGDYYGEVVNLASRIADQAAPGEVLVDESTATATGEYKFDAVGHRILKGFPDPVALFALKRQ